jgi:hypothetical protein
VIKEVEVIKTVPIEILKEVIVEVPIEIINEVKV